MKYLLIRIAKILFSLFASVCLIYLAFEYKNDFSAKEGTFVTSMAGGVICLSYFFNGLKRLGNE
ncbi:hypothetical protein [Echinicola strongylocentroti]|nr:hypothetical protein [Echinicola strongylocentroti]